MFKGFGFLFQLLLFPFLQVCICQLIDLETQVVLILLTGFRLFQCLFQLFGETAIGLVFGLVGIERFLMVGNNVEHVQLEVLLAQQQVLVLGMYVEELFTQFFQLRQRGRGVVDEGTRLTHRGEFTTDDALCTIEIEVILLKERFQSVLGEVERGFHHTAFGVCLDGTGVGTLSQQQAYGTNDDGFTSTRLTRDDRETCVEIHIQMLNQCVILYVQMTYHFLILFQ